MGEKLSTKICTSIRDDIISGKIDTKTFLSEAEIGKRFGVSRAPVRDALHLLCEQGYLISYPRKGYMVNSYSVEEINKIQVIRIHIEKLCVKLAIKNATDEEIKSLREFTKTQNMQNNPSKTNNTQFHMSLSEITKNEFIPKILYDILVKATSVMVKAESDLESHDKIIDALLKRDEKEAVERLIEDIKLM